MNPQEVHPLELDFIEAIAFLESAIANAKAAQAAAAAPASKMADKGPGRTPIGVVMVPGGGNVNPYEPNDSAWLEYWRYVYAGVPVPGTGGNGNSGGGGGGGW